LLLRLEDFLRLGLLDLPVAAQRLEVVDHPGELAWIGGNSMNDFMLRLRGHRRLLVVGIPQRVRLAAAGAWAAVAHLGLRGQLGEQSRLDAFLVPLGGLGYFHGAAVLAVRIALVQCCLSAATANTISSTRHAVLFSSTSPADSAGLGVIG
jgi:hypothetical protein